MRKRIAKKNRVGRYRELGFEAAWRYRSGTTSDEIDAFWDAFIERIEERGLVFGGGGREPDAEGYVTRPAPPGATIEDRDAILQWLVSHPSLENASAGPLTDAWHPAE